MKLLLSLSVLCLTGFAFGGDSVDIANQIHQANLKACDCGPDCKCEPCLCNALKSTILLTNSPQKLKATDGGPDWTFDGKHWCRQVTEYLYTDGKGYTSDPCPGGVCPGGVCPGGVCLNGTCANMGGGQFMSGGSCSSGSCGSGSCGNGGGRRRR